MPLDQGPMYTDTPLAVIPTPMYETGEVSKILAAHVKIDLMTRTDIPIQKDAFTLEASKMALSHNAFIRGFNSIYQQAPRVPAPDKADFVGYCIAWHDCVDAHHRYEETAFIPNVNKAAGQTGLMDAAIEEHALFHDGMERFKAYLVKEGADFAPASLLAIMASFMAELHAHLAAEPASIVALARHSTPERPVDILAIADAAARSQIRLGLVFNALPVFYLNMNHAEFEGGMWDGVFPSFRGTGRALLTRGIPLWHARRWRFASCSPEGRVKRLAF
ncbi:hemerythrin HHE cation binding domain-containing protein [Apiospora rasikravindrae]|uniref:Hemerythrin HHE cation binding domain-containing protein n=1 Tax=Apiospora rasikravindrae TaxID=990691 RepID=A0ABR1TA84_9PEZI